MCLLSAHPPVTRRRSDPLPPSAICLSSCQVLGASPFSDEAHTGEAIEKKTDSALERAGIGGLKPDMMFFPVSDNGSNMVSGWAPFGRGPC
eukprot:956610-Prymnesium_polylepis.1